MLTAMLPRGLRHTFPPRAAPQGDTVADLTTILCREKTQGGTWSSSPRMPAKLVVGLGRDPSPVAGLFARQNAAVLDLSCQPPELCLAGCSHCRRSIFCSKCNVAMHDKDRKDGTHCSKTGWLCSALQKNREILKDYSSKILVNSFSCLLSMYLTKVWNLTFGYRFDPKCLHPGIWFSQGPYLAVKLNTSQTAPF